MLRFYNKKKDDWLLQLLFGMSLIVFIGAVIVVGNYMIKSFVNTSKQNTATDIIDNLPDNSDSENLVDRYETIRDKYPDIVGRLIISNYNNVNDLIVMQSDDNKYYLYRDVNREDSDAGTTFLDYRCRLDELTDNLILYAHNMKNRTQFGCLRYYKQKNYWEKYPTVTFETMYDKPVKYEIFAAFYSRRYYKNEVNAFKYYDFCDAANEAEFDDFVSRVKKLALYDTGITPKYGEQLLTLSTCDATFHKEGRFVVVARKKTGRIPGNLKGSIEENSVELEEIEETLEPTKAPVVIQTKRPVVTPTPTRKPTLAPTVVPTVAPTVEPTIEAVEPTYDVDLPMITPEIYPTLGTGDEDYSPNVITPR